MASPDYYTLLERFAAGWNAHDAEALMACMTPDCIYRAAAGEAASGKEFRGQAEVREAFAQIFHAFPDAAWRNPSHHVARSHGCSTWRFVAKGKATGVLVEVDGVDIFELRDGLIAVKDTYRKNRSAAPDQTQREPKE